MRIKEILNNLPPPMPTITLTGDLNFPLIIWNTESVYGGTSDMRTPAEVQLVGESCLIQSIDIPARDNNIIDVVRTNNDQLLYDYTVNKTNLSDHNIITITTNITKEVYGAPN